MQRFSLFCALVVLFAFNGHAQKIIPLYNGVAPGSENWTWQEKTVSTGNTTMVVDVAKPTLTAYLPAKPNGTAVIIAPGGAFHILAIDHEGTDVAKWLTAKGITAFVLKYRLVHDDPARPENGLMALLGNKNFKKLDYINAPVVEMALQDGLTAVKHVRQNAAAYHIDPAKIGFMGFSAGGTLTLSVVYSATDESRPNFVAPIYAYGNAVIGSTVPETKTPIFLAVASDDGFGFAPHSVQIYTKWLEAKQPAELHVYAKGDHGFGMRKQGLPSDTWIERFGDWLVQQGLLKPAP